MSKPFHRTATEIYDFDLSSENSSATTTATRGTSGYSCAKRDPGTRFANLDQWRGWALILVLVNHGFKWTGAVEGLGRSGVNLFFVISGLLTAMSLMSLRKKGQNYLVELPKKRAWRIVPTLLGFLILASLVQGLSGQGWGAPKFLHAFYANYVKPVDGLAHLWSITCEMHFYALSPLFFWIGIRGKVGAAFLWGILALLCACMVIHILMKMDAMGGATETLAQFKFHRKYPTHVAVWPMLFGFCWFLYGMRFPKWVSGVLSKYLAVTIVAAHLAIVVALLLGERFLTVLIALGLIPILLFSFQESRSIRGRVGEALTWIGQRTFSIYLVQQMLTLDLPGSDYLKPLGALLAIPAGALFYCLVEKRFIK